MASDELAIEFLDAGIVECPGCRREVQTVARVAKRDADGAPTIEQRRFGRCGVCDAEIDWPLAPNGLN